MATETKTSDQLDYPVTFEVTNTGKRHRFRNGRNFLAAAGDEKPEPVTITVGNRAEFLRLKGCRDLQLKARKGKKGGGGGSGDPLVDDNTSEELQEMAAERELSTSGTKAELAARIREHDAAERGSEGGGS